ncbi:MAG: peptide ABC transporter substrate-binding protein [Xenococcaceae cyanobacterium]
MLSQKLLVRFLSVFCLPLLSASVLTACNSTSDSVEQKSNGEVLKLLYWQAPTILNPHLSNGTKDWEASRITLEPLASFNNDGELIPVLAAEVPNEANGLISADGKSVTWKLKEDIKWSDGTPFTAADVIFTYKFATNPAVGAITAGIYQSIESIDAIDDYTIRVNFKDVNPAWFSAFVGVEGTILPKHIFEDYNGANVREAPANLMPIGTGPYKVVEFKPGDIVVYEPNPEFPSADRLAFERVELKGGGDATSAARAVLQTGDADFANNLQVEAPVLKQLEAGGKGQVVSNPGAGMERLMLNQTDPNKATESGERSSLKFPHPFLTNTKVRQALSLAVDRDTIAEQLYGVTGEPTANFLVTPPEFVSPNTSYEFNLEKAATLLDQSGWKDTNGNGIRDRNGVEMNILFQTSVNPLRQKTQEIIKQAWQSLGVGVELKSIDASIFFSSDPASNDTVEHFYADVQMFSRYVSMPDPLVYMQTLTCQEIPQKANGWVGDNASRYCNPEYDQMWLKAKTELDREKRKQIFVQMNDLLINKAQVIPIIHRSEVIGVGNNLAGLDMTPWDTVTWNIMNWHRPE